MRRIASIVFLLAAVAWTLQVAEGSAEASGKCWTDPEIGIIVCSEVGGTVTPGVPGSEDEDPEKTARRYVYALIDATIGDCFSWSSIPGGLDSLDPANDAAIIALITSRPACPVVAIPPVDPVASAWAIFRAWDLAVPVPAITPASRGITGIPTHIGVDTPTAISSSEVLPDGRILTVRARTERLVIDWGDGTTTSTDPRSASGYPDGAAHHTFARKTCTTEYRTEHPSGGLCHPSAAFYPIVTSFVWTGEFNTGFGWLPLGSLTRSAEPANYDVDEARGVTTP
ncbi:MAG: hypothetical protein GWP18_06085 [Proteobacteria bacterium]|nr:hypothetical protein [Pseudomonadota bacterium]